jgi:hypothetical protein
MACKSWYPCGTLRWCENGGQAGVGTGRAAARWCGFAGWLRGLAAGVAWVWQGAGGCPLTQVFLSGTQARMQVWRRGLDLRVAHCCLEQCDMRSHVVSEYVGGGSAGSKT